MNRKCRRCTLQGCCFWRVLGIPLPQLLSLEKHPPKLSTTKSWCRIWGWIFFFTSINRTLPKFNSSPLKNKAWKTLFVLGKTVTFQGRTVKLRGCSSSFVSRIQPIDDTIPVPPFHLPLHFRDRIRPRIFLPRPGGHAWTEMAPVVGTMWCLVSS